MPLFLDRIPNLQRVGTAFEIRSAQQSASEEDADKDEGFVSRRVDVVIAGKDNGEKTAANRR